MFYAKEFSDTQSTLLLSEGKLRQQVKPALARVLLSPFMLIRVEASGVACPAPMGFQADGVVIAVFGQGLELAYPIDHARTHRRHSYFLPGGRMTSFTWQ